MLIEHHHDRTANAILYFVGNTSHCTQAKLMHLLYLLDFEHFAVTGRCVLGGSYCALPTGPAPAELYWEFHRPAGIVSYLDGLVRLQDAHDPNSSLLALRSPVEDDFTKRQITLMSNIAAEFRSDTGEKLTARVCFEGKPWHQVYRGGRGQFAVIPYELALDGLPNREQLLDSAREHRQFRQSFVAAKQRQL